MFISGFWLTAHFPNPFTILLAIILLSGRQLAFGLRSIHRQRCLYAESPKKSCVRRERGRSIANFRNPKPRNRHTLARSSSLYLFMLLVLNLLGHARLFLLWVIAFTTSYILVTRIRPMADHATVPDQFNSDVHLNTRTTYISILERLLIAPHQVSFHLRYHMLVSVPIYKYKNWKSCITCCGQGVLI